MSNVSTKLVYLDLKFILENYKKPKFWQQQWLIFSNKEMKIYWKMTSIDVINNKIKSCVLLDYGDFVRGGKRFWCYSMRNNIPSYDWGIGMCKAIPIDNREYTQKHFENNILGTCIECIKKLERELTEQTYEYEEAERLESSIRESLEEIANDFLDSEGVTNDAIRDAYVEKYLDDNFSNEHTEAILNNSQFRFFKTLYLHLCSWFNRDDMFNDYKKQLSKYVKKKQIFAILKKKKEIQTEEWLDSMKDELESVY